MPETSCHPATRGRNQNDTSPDVRVAEVAREQHGIISAAQLAACGVSATMISRRVRDGRLHRVHRGVYAVGHAALTIRARFVAAVLACGDQAVLSHRAAAVYWGFERWEDREPEVMVTGAARRVEGVRVRRSRTLDRRDIARRHGILISSPARTILDLATVLPPRALRRAARQAQAEQQVNVRQLIDVLTRNPGHQGARAVRALVADGPAPTRSELEDLALDLLGDAGIERPEVNPTLHLDGRAIKPDLLWADVRLVVELDGAAWHDERLAREDDAERQASLEANGYRVLRITWRQLLDEPRQTLARIRAALGLDA
ncbi:MAG TPA: type IV toxin-antitoxin system AbiEi family antitoxin domain-containing protein [Solirubrobacteraceae bacterium]|nr:type IV toxin-antitoxin system AbiEi family antitoxin domain-containing protein [Solirubrobacteraceae bacterium]